MKIIFNFQYTWVSLVFSNDPFNYFQSIICLSNMVVWWNTRRFLYYVNIMSIKHFQQFTFLSLKVSPFLLEIKSLLIQPLFIKNVLTKFQNCLLEGIPYSELLLRYFILNFLQIVSRLFFILLICTKFSLEGYFRYLFRSHDLFMIAFLSSFVINLALFPFVFFCFIGACLSVIVFKRLGKHYKVYHCFKSSL